MSSSPTDQKQGDLLEATPAGPAVEPFRAKNEYFTPSNLISLMRAMMVFPAIFTIMAHLYVLTAAICVAAYISDLLDGILARRYDSVTEFGKVIDPLADKIYIGLLVIAMTAYGLVPLWFLLVILGRDLLIVLGGLWAKRKLGVVLPSNYPGKAAALTTATTLFLVLAGLSGQAVAIMEYLSVALMALSFAVYGQRLRSLLIATRTA